MPTKGRKGVKNDLRHSRGVALRLYLMEVLIKAGQFLLSLSFLIVLHELGHFIPARLFKTRVEKFFLFFDIKGALFQKKIGETVYGIGWLPLGGYVKIAGMVDESMDKEQMAKPPQPWEFRSKPAWQRLIIMLGGVTVNLILGVLIYGMVFFVWGERDLKMNSLPYGLSFAQPLEEVGLQDGDVVLTLGGEPVSQSQDFQRLVFGGEVTSAEVRRNGVTETLNFPVELGQVLVDAKDNLPKGTAPFSVNYPSVVDRVIPGSGAEEAGLQNGDRIVSVQGESTPYFPDLVAALSQYAGQSVSLGIVRGAQTESGEPAEFSRPRPVNENGIALTAKVDDTGKIGFYPKTFAALDGFEFVEQEFGPVAALSAGASKTATTLNNYVSSLRFLFRPGGTKQLGGFLTLGSIFSPEWNWQSFWNITALLSIILAFMNLLPIPALDGGHVVFLLYEMVSGRKPSEKVLEYGQLIGLILVGGLMLVANGNDLVKWFTGQF